MMHVSLNELKEALGHLRLMIRHVALDPRMGARARWLLLGLLLFMLAINGLNVVNSYVGRDFMTAIEQHDRSGFWLEALLYVGVFGLLTTASVLSRYCEESLALLWRQWMTWRLFELYADHRVYLRLEHDARVENPDQRIAEDVRNFTTTTISFILMLSNGLLTVIAFSGVLITISPMLFFVAIGYAIAGTWLTIHFGKPLVQLNYQQLDKEAAFRSSLIHIRENADMIALSRREDLWSGRLWDRLEALAQNMAEIIRVNRNVGFLTTGYSWLIQIIPALIVAPLFIEGKAEFGIITQAAIAFTQLMGAFSLIITQFQSISSFLAVIRRLSGMTGAILDEQALERQAVLDCQAGTDPDCRVVIEGLTLGSVNNHHVLVESLNLEIEQGRPLVVQSPDGSTLSALFRAIAGIWPKCEGTIHRPPLDQCLFVSERPYLPPCSLRDLFVRPYPEPPEGDTAPARPLLAAIETTDDVIRAALLNIGLGDILAHIEDFEELQDWESSLSLSEQQLLVLARVLISGARFLFIDRLSSSLEPGLLASTLKQLNDKGMTLVRFEPLGEAPGGHLALLVINEKGQWTYVAAP